MYYYPIYTSPNEVIFTVKNPGPRIQSYPTWITSSIVSRLSQAEKFGRCGALNTGAPQKDDMDQLVAIVFTMINFERPVFESED